MVAIPSLGPHQVTSPPSTKHIPMSKVIPFIGTSSEVLRIIAIVDDLLAFGKYPTDAEATLLYNEGYTVFLDLTAIGECADGPYYGDLLPDDSIIRFPVEDHRAPPVDAKLRALIGRLCWLYRKGVKVYYHCRGGHGRSAAIIAIVYGIVRALTAEQVLKIVYDAHQLRTDMGPQDARWRKMGAPQTKVQKELVKNVLAEAFSYIIRDRVTSFAVVFPVPSTDSSGAKYSYMDLPKTLYPPDVIELISGGEHHCEMCVFNPSVSISEETDCPIVLCISTLRVTYGDVLESDYYAKNDDGNFTLIFVDEDETARMTEEVMTLLGGDQMRMDILTKYLSYMNPDARDPFLCSVLEKGREYLLDFVDPEIDDVGEVVFSYSLEEFTDKGPEGSIARLGVYNMFIDALKTVSKEERTRVYAMLDAGRPIKLDTIGPGRGEEKRRTIYTYFVGKVRKMSAENFTMFVDGLKQRPPHFLSPGRG